MKPVKKTPRIIESFLDKVIVVVLSDIRMMDEQGEMPMVCEGILYDFDDMFLLIGNKTKTMFSLLNYNNIAKIDLIDESELAMMEDPESGSMN